MNELPTIAIALLSPPLPPLLLSPPRPPLIKYSYTLSSLSSSLVP